MSRLIDADALSEWILGQCKSPSCPKSECAFGIRIMKYIDRMPSAQPEIILCKDCEHWKNEHLCERLSRFGSFETEADFYCGYGKRRS